jgi:hypothetical protein
MRILKMAKICEYEKLYICVHKLINFSAVASGLHERRMHFGPLGLNGPYEQMSMTICAHVSSYECMLICSSHKIVPDTVVRVKRALWADEHSLMSSLKILWKTHFQRLRLSRWYDSVINGITLRFQLSDSVDRWFLQVSSQMIWSKSFSAETVQ